MLQSLPRHARVKPGRRGYGKIAFTTSSIARLLSASSVSDQVTATVAARRGAIPCRISSPA